MTAYEYQILRYRPDQVSEEFVNVGIVLYEPVSRVLYADFAKSVARITGLFPGADGRQLQRRLRHLEGMFLGAAGQTLQFDDAATVLDISRRYLTPDDTALYFTPVQRGIDDNVAVVFAELYERIVEQHAAETVEAARNDYEVWTRMFKPFFQDLGIARRLEKHTVATANDNLEFSHAWKNEIWHCFEPVAFNLKRPDSIKSKVYKWVGKLDELRNSSESVDIKLLTALPEHNEEILAFILEKLDQKVFGNSTVSVVRQSAAAQLAETVRQEIAAHDAEDDSLPF